MDQVVRCCILHASSVAKTFLTSDLAVVEKKTEPIQLPRLLPTPNMMMPKMTMPHSGSIFFNFLLMVL